MYFKWKFPVLAFSVFVLGLHFNARFVQASSVQGNHIYSQRTTLAIINWEFENLLLGTFDFLPFPLRKKSLDTLLPSTSTSPLVLTLDYNRKKFIISCLEIQGEYRHPVEIRERVCNQR